MYKFWTESQEQLLDVYDRLDDLSADTAEARAAHILHGLGFTKEMQQKATKDFSGGNVLNRWVYLSITYLLLQNVNERQNDECLVIFYNINGQYFWRNSACSRLKQRRSWVRFPLRVDLCFYKHLFLVCVYILMGFPIVSREDVKEFLLVG